MATDRHRAPIPVTVLTGALGAGKTTLLNAALRSGALRNAAVIVNEFGAIGIDNELIETASEDVVLLPGGCVCCQVRADLAVALLRLDRGAARGEVPAFERVIVETSGLAEPGPILQLFSESPGLVGRYRLAALVSVVDGLLGEAALAEEGAAFRQALLADRLIVTKGELIADDALTRLETRLDEINPYAERRRAARDAADAAWFGPASPCPTRIISAAALRATHDDAIESFVLQWAEPQPLAAIGDWLQRLAETYGARLLRVKGIVTTTQSAFAVAVHAIQHIVAPPEFLGVTGRDSRVVFITRGLEAGDVAPGWRVTVGRAPSHAVLPSAVMPPIAPVQPAATPAALSDPSGASHNL